MATYLPPHWPPSAGLTFVCANAQAGAAAEHMYHRVHVAPVVDQVQGALRAFAARGAGGSGAAGWEPPQLAAIGASFASLAVSDAERSRAVCVCMCVCVCVMLLLRVRRVAPRPQTPDARLPGLS
jgi:hypothetical protein